MPLPVAVAVSYGPCPTHPDALGCADPAGARVWVLRRSDLATRYHELGHVWTRQMLDAMTPARADATRAWFTRALGRPAGEAWYREPGQTSADERLAEAYAACAMPDRRGSMTERAYGYELRGRRHQAICNAINLLGHVR